MKAICCIILLFWICLGLFYSLGWDLYSHHSPTLLGVLFLPVHFLHSPVHSLHIHSFFVFDTSTCAGLANILYTHFILKRKNVHYCPLVISLLVYVFEEASGFCFCQNSSGVIHLFHWHRDQHIQGEWLAFRWLYLPNLVKRCRGRTMLHNVHSQSVPS